MIVMQWLVSSALFFVGGWIVLANWVIAFRRGGSLIPFLGGIFVAIAFLVVPLDVLRGVWWLPLLIDLGCVPIVVLAGGHAAWNALFGRNRTPDA
jgi:hypothetical protein